MTTGKPISGEEWRDIEEGICQTTSADDSVLRHARKGIEQHRKRDIVLRFTDRSGNPLVRKQIDVDQKSHAFLFGDQLWHLDALIRDGRGDSDRALAWKGRFKDVFNAATSLFYWTERPRNDAAKTEDRQGEPRIENSAATVDWTLANGMVAKGHPMFWSIPKCLPEWLKRYDMKTFMVFVEARCRSLAARFRDRITVWDVVNEPLWEAAPKNLSKRQWPHVEPVEAMVEYIAPVMQWVREEAPEATLLVNDYGLEQSESITGSDDTEITAIRQRQRMLELIRALADAKAAPDAIGMQAHTGGWLSPTQQVAVYDELATAGLPLHITEFWARTKALSDSGRYSSEEIDEMQAEYVERYMTCAFGHPGLEAFFFWGFMDDALHWRDDFSSHETRPVYERVKQLIRKTWHTQESLMTNEDGEVSFRGFAGNYAARIDLQDATRSLAFRLDQSPTIHFNVPLTES